MIEALKADLQTLSDAVPLLAQHVTHATESAQALDTAAQELQQEIDAARADASAQLVILRDALPSLAVQVDADAKQIEGAAAAATAGWSTAETALEGAGEKVGTHADELVASARDLVALLAEVGTRIDQSQAVGEAALARLPQVAHDAEERIRAALQTLHAEIAELRHSTSAAGNTLINAAQRLLSGLAGAADDAQHGFDHALQAMHDAAGPRKEAAHDLVATLAQQVMEEAQASEGQIEHAVLATIADAHAGVRLELERVGADTGKHEETLAQHGQTLDGAAQSAHDEAAAIPADHDHIQQAAHQLGIQT